MIEQEQDRRAQRPLSPTLDQLAQLRRRPPYIKEVEAAGFRLARVLEGAPNPETLLTEAREALTRAAEAADAAGLKDGQTLRQVSGTLRFQNPPIPNPNP
ncbi:MAG: hypothetical protein ACI9WU_004367 [Myxococcota bacterium]|jgi:hypothetical protein